jgi:hypothetical protein
LACGTATNQQARAGWIAESVMTQLRLLIFVILYPIVHLAWVIFHLWPIAAGIYFGWGVLGGLGLWMLWWIPATIIVVKKDRWQWWNRVLDSLNSFRDNRNEMATSAKKPTTDSANPWANFPSREYLRSEYRQGYPTATEAELDLLQDAEEKSGGKPPHDLEHARKILGLNKADD